jgi:PAS domain S-box-containing protein
MSFENSDFGLFKDFPEPVFVMDPDGTILDANRYFMSRFDHLNVEIIGNNVFALLLTANYPPEIAANRKARAEEVLRIGKYVTFDDVLKGRVLRNSVYPIRNDDGQIARLLVISIDVTEQKQAEKEHEDFRAKMDFALESSHVGVWMLDLEKNIVLRTKEHDRIFGYESLLPKWTVESFFQHVYHEDLDIVKKTYNNAMSDKSDVKLDCRIRRADGETRWINLVCTYKFSKDRDKRYVVGIIEDITEQKLAAIDRERLLAQLLQAQKMDLIGQLAGGIAHDYNNALTAIIGNADILLSKIDPSLSIAENIRDIQKTAIRSANLTRQLLGFARKQMALPKILSLNNAVENLIPMLSRLLGEQISFRWIPDKNNPLVYIDPSQLDQILSNLCINARDAITGAGTISISTDTTGYIAPPESIPGPYGENSGDCVRLSVSDTGSGIDSKALPHIFEPFFTTKGIDKGVGLGLSTVYGIVSQNNGRIDCQTEPGKGTKFNIYLPRHLQCEEKDPAAPAGNIPETSSDTVLLVEDEPNILKILKNTLEDKGFLVLSALDGETASIIAENYEGRIDLLITDIVLPKMTGIALSEKLQASNPDLGSLFMSGFTVEILSQQGMSTKTKNFIQKPFELNDFLMAVHHALSKPHQP